MSASAAEEYRLLTEAIHQLPAPVAAEVDAALAKHLAALRQQLARNRRSTTRRRVTT